MIPTALEAARSRRAEPGASLRDEDVRSLVAESCPTGDYQGKRVLLIVPDSTRTAPIGTLFKAIHGQIGDAARQVDVMIALGTHKPMSEEKICGRLEISMQERRGRYRNVAFLNHDWENDAALERIGTISKKEISRLSGGLFEMDVPVRINKTIRNYDELMIVGPVFPHEVVGCSGGNKYLFPGISGPEVLNFFHWLGAVVTNPMIIGYKHTPVRAVVDMAASLVPVPRTCFAAVMDRKEFAGLFFGTPEQAWEAASDLSRERNIIRKPRPYATVISCLPSMYDELWVGGKGVYKMEPVVADGGEVIVFAPHLQEISATHGRFIREIGYHTRDYFRAQWDKFRDYPWGVLAHSTHVKGIGAYDAASGVETPRMKVTLATGLDADTCRNINLGFRDPATVLGEFGLGHLDPVKLSKGELTKTEWSRLADLEARGVLVVPKAGEMLYTLEKPPRWADGKIA
jgi:nickel-dependent lactate racemase